MCIIVKKKEKQCTEISVSEMIIILVIMIIMREPIQLRKIQTEKFFLFKEAFLTSMRKTKDFHQLLF